MQEKQNNRRRRPSRFYWIGDHLVPDWANSVRSPADGEEALRSWSDVQDFLCTAGLGTYEDAALGPAKDQRHAALAAARELRAAARHLLMALTQKTRIARQAVDTLNRVLASDSGYPQLIRRHGAWQLVHQWNAPQPETALAQIARSCADLIASPARYRVRKCRNPKCVLFFVDVSRTGRRKWCSMEGCGNRAKVARHYRRNRP